MKNIKMLLIGLSLFAPSFSFAVSPALQCAVDLCGPLESYVIGGYGNREVPVSKEVQQYLEQKFKASLYTIMNLQEKNAFQQITSLNAVASGATKMKLSREQKSVFVARYFAAIMPWLEPTAIGQGDQRMLTAESMEQLLPEKSANERELIRQYINLRVNSSYYNIAEIVPHVSLETFAKMAVGVDLDESPKEFAKFLENVYRNSIVLNRTLGEFIFPTRDVQFLASMVKAKKLTNYQKAYLKEVLERAFSLLGSLEPATVNAANKIEIDISQAALEIGRVRGLDEILINVKSSQSLETSKVDTFDHCSSFVRDSIASAPSALRARKALELHEKVKASARKAAVRYFTGEALAVAQNAISTAKIVTVDNLTQLNEKVEFLLKRERLNAADFSQKLDSFKGDEFMQGSLLVATIEKLSKITPILFAPLQESCAKLGKNDFNDQAFAEIGVIEASWQSSMFFDAGAGVIAHEIGHVVDLAIQLNKALGKDVTSIADVKSCSLNFHTAIKKSLDRSAVGAGNYAAEDWADTFSQTTMREFSKAWSYNANPTCFFMTSSNSGDPLDDPSDEGHTPTLLRALKFHISQDKSVPASCKEFIPASAYQAVVRSCEP